MPRLSVRHVTAYTYAEPVGFGDHRLMVRPRDSHDLRLLEATLAIDPPPERIRWLHDVFGNSVAVASFGEARSTTLRFESRLLLDLYQANLPEYQVADYARTYPFSYEAEEVPDLARTMERHYADPEHAVDLWAKGFVRVDGPTDTYDLLTWMTRAIQTTFTYAARDEEGVQTPVETLSRGTGSCRDLALLMMEAARSLGFAARFVSGYLYSPDADGTGNVGGGSTHAWCQVYLPGAGWVEFDPTNGITGNRDLIRIAVARDPAQAAPLQGSFVGPAGAFQSLVVDVTVTDASSE
ncbi:transglutaminase family protein [Salinarimonas soli]|uniref:Transglutaminase family protein n=1 Tax=Salinarimonas soli TaxID=1638099 RepID=A0A5B2VFJ8_9HYPH|nr:transglutaminase family protein [Salinarimonas soli]KAA2237122.1 transglutaminase family protein [Salinarimonas soli]